MGTDDPFPEENVGEDVHPILDRQELVFHRLQIEVQLLAKGGVEGVVIELDGDGLLTYRSIECAEDEDGAISCVEDVAISPEVTKRASIFQTKKTMVSITRIHSSLLYRVNTALELECVNTYPSLVD